MKVSKGLKAMFWLLLAVAIIGGALWLARVVQGRRISALEGEIGSLKQEHVNLRFSITERAQEGLSARIKLYTADGKEIGVLEDSWPGERLFIDFILVKMGSGYLSFPYRVFTDAIPAAEGRDLTVFYDKAGFPAVFDQAGLSRSARAGLQALFLKVKAGEYPPSSFGNALHEIGGISEFNTGLVYRAVARLSGGMEIMED